MSTVGRPSDVTKAIQRFTSDDLVQRVAVTTVYPAAMDNSTMVIGTERKRACHERQTGIVILTTCRKPSFLAHRYLPMHIMPTKG